MCMIFISHLSFILLPIKSIWQRLNLWKAYGYLQMILLLIETHSHSIWPSWNSTGVFTTQERSPVLFAFISGTFRNASFRWYTPEQKCYAIVSNVLVWHINLLLVDSYHYLTIKNNILYKLSLTLSYDNVARNVENKTKRWKIRISEFKFATEHIHGERNMWACILIR